MDPTFWATSAGAAVAVIAIGMTYFGIHRQIRQNFDLAGAQAAIAWRQQVFDLHDRGLSAGEIRYIMYCERGGKGYESGNGLIDDIIHNVPRRTSTDPLDMSKESSRRSEPQPENLPSWNGDLKPAP